ncbi:MAG: metal ABC transporter ATP-binding protein [Chloroflexi bacterium]|nr:metal ABC transporter ATP-binding protein [Chloroflexota bacterium]
MVELRDVTVAYADNAVLNDVTLSIPQGAHVAVVGPNGAGKSTLFKALAGLIPLQQGSILWRGKSLGASGVRIAYIPQRCEVDWEFPVLVRDVVLMGRYRQIGWLHRPSARDQAATMEALAQLGIANLATSPIGELSGGQQQRAFLARSLAQEAELLLADEPFTGVDASTQEVILRVFEDLRERGVTVLVSTHDLNMAINRFTTSMLLNQRLIAFGPSEEVFTSDLVRHTFDSQVYEVDGGLVIDQCCSHDGEFDNAHELQD